MPINQNHRRNKRISQNTNSKLQENQDSFIHTDIRTDNIGIICTDLNLTLSNERLKGVMSHLYETAHSNACKPGWCNHCDVWFSLALTVFIALMSSECKDFPVISGNTLKITFWCGFGICLLIGIISIFAKNLYHNNVNINRDLAVENSLQEIIQAGKMKPLTSLSKRSS